MQFVYLLVLYFGKLIVILCASKQAKCQQVIASEWMHSHLANSTSLMLLLMVAGLYDWAVCWLIHWLWKVSDLAQTRFVPANLFLRLGLWLTKNLTLPNWKKLRLVVMLQLVKIEQQKYFCAILICLDTLLYLFNVFHPNLSLNYSPLLHVYLETYKKLTIRQFF